MVDDKPILAHSTVIFHVLLRTVIVMLFGLFVF